MIEEQEKSLVDEEEKSAQKGPRSRATNKKVSTDDYFLLGFCFQIKIFISVACVKCKYMN